MNSKVTSKYQTTIPREVRRQIGIEVSDILEWVVEGAKVIVYPANTRFLRHRNTIATGPGDIDDDIERARQSRLSKHE